MTAYTQVGRRAWIVAPRIAGLIVALLGGAALPASGQEADPTVRELASLDLDQLARVRVVSAGRKPEALADATAAIAVLTHEDIRRHGAATLPELLRSVPGLDVARVGGRDWAISARGFTSQSSNKLLVVVDGRTVYSPIFAGTYWDVLSVPIDEIERIEVIRGPGGTLWGANAMNGVINIITRPASESAGGRAAVAAGTWDHAFGSARYGGGMGENVAYRAYVAGRQRDEALLLDGSRAEDDWLFGQTGFRVDGMPSEQNHWTLQGDLYRGRGGNRLLLPTPATPPYGEFVIDDMDVSGGNLLARWTSSFGPESQLNAQVYYDRARREQSPLFGSIAENTIDLEVQQRFPLLGAHDIVVGVGYRILGTDATGGQGYSFDPAERTTHLFTGFVQDEIELIQNRFAVTLGTKVEHNSYTGFELHPNARLRWTPSPRHSLWAAVSRAVRTPSRIDADAVATSPAMEPRFEARLLGSEGFVAERLVAYELGYRLEAAERLSFDLSLFHNDYDRLRTLSVGTIEFVAPRAIVPFVIDNQSTGRTRGVELAATWRAAPAVRVRGSYAYLDATAELTAGAPAGTLLEAAPENNPEHQVDLWASFDVSRSVELDVSGRYVSARTGAQIPEYASADVRLGWSVNHRIGVSLVGQGLFQHHHREFPGGSAFVPDARAIPRRAYAKVVWQF